MYYIRDSCQQKHLYNQFILKHYQFCQKILQILLQSKILCFLVLIASPPHFRKCFVNWCAVPRECSGLTCTISSAFQRGLVLNVLICLFLLPILCLLLQSSNFFFVFLWQFNHVSLLPINQNGSLTSTGWDNFWFQSPTVNLLWGRKPI